MQDIMQRLGLPTDDAPVMSQNHAAIALATAMQKARAEFADREGVKQEARSFGTAKLESLRRQLVPLYSAIPRDAEFLDLGIVMPDKPRLFVDILAYVEPSRDQTGFRLVQESRNGRATLAETADETSMVEAVTAYIARRLVERERALSAETAPTIATNGHAEEAKAVALETPLPPVAPAAPAALAVEAAAPVKLPLTAEEAFKQWTRMPAQVTAATAASTGDAVSAQAPSVTVSEVPPEPPKTSPETTSVLATSIATAAASAVAVPVIAAAAKAMPVDMRAAQPASVTGAQTTTTSEPPPRPAPVAPLKPSRSSGSWLWPLLALLIGAALGAAALYLYAASLVR